MITTPCYCNRLDVQRATDLESTVLDVQRIDEAIQGASRDVEEGLHRLFYPWDGSKFFEWPNYQYAYPWRLWLDRHDLLCLTTLVTGFETITLDKVFLEPVNRKPGFPYRWAELDRASNAAFGGNSQTPQHAITLTGTWGFTADAFPVATAPSAVGDSDTAIVISDGSQVSAGDLVILGYARTAAPYPDDALGHAGVIKPYAGERCLVRDVAFTATGGTQSGSGCSTAAESDNQLTVSGATVTAGETLLLDAERMLVLQVAGSVATVKRAWDGTVLDSHSAADVYALRQLTVKRGALGTTATAWDEGTAVWKHRVPGPVRELTIAIAQDTVMQQTSGYARTAGTGDSAAPAVGTGIGMAWKRAADYAMRQARTRVI
jgi:hypothetical protein